jgi:DNA-binding transcriptional regulator PaaX
MRIVLPNVGKPCPGLSREIETVRLRDPCLPEPGLDKTVQDRIGRELRALYAKMVRQPTPQRFLDLLTKVEAQKDQDR